MDVGKRIRDPPRDLRVVPDDHTEGGRKGEADDIERRIHPLQTVQTDLVPNCGKLDPEVRIVGQQRPTAFRPFATDYPGVRPSTRTGAEGGSEDVPFLP